MNEEQMNRLQKIQNRAMRIILRLSKYTSVKLMLDTLQWQSVRQRLTYNSLIMIHKINNDMMPQYLKQNLQKVNETNSYNTRNKNNFRLPMYKKTQTQNNIFYKGVKQYNDLSKEMKEEKRLHIFKRKLNEWIREKNKL